MSNDRRPDANGSLEASRRKFETVFEHANDAIFIVDVENDSVVDCNPAAEELVEYSREQLLSMPASDLHPHNLSEFMDFAETVLEEGQGWTDEVTCYCKSGDIIPAEMSASVVELDGRPHLVNHVRETSDREERDWFEALLEHSSDLITVVKSDGVVRYQSASVDNVLGYDPDELRDERYFEFVHPDDEGDLRAVFERVADHAASAVERLEYRFRRAEGSWAWLQGVVSHRPASPVSGYVVNARDVTPRRESQQQAAVLNRVLRHNLRNGLTVILGRAQQITAADADADAADVASAAEAILSTAQDLHDTTSYTGDLADIIESHHVTQRRYDVTGAVERAVDRLAEARPNAAVEVDTPAEQPVMAAPKLEVALDHVLENAVAHNDTDAPRVEVSVRPPASDAGYVEVTVADNGPGIPRQEREVLLEGQEEPLRHGSGLGLWIVNWVVTRSGGQIAFDENEPRGSRVTLALPPGT